MKFSWEVLELKLKETFRISRGEVDCKKIVIAHLDEGLGEASPSNYYNENFETVISFFDKAQSKLNDKSGNLEEILENLDKIPNLNYSGKAAIDMALYDLLGKKNNIPLYEYLNLTGEIKAPISYTIGIDSLEKMQEKTHKAVGFDVYKVKVGFPGDIEIVKGIRDVTDKKIRVDANGGWSAEEASKKNNQLEEVGVELVEQPLKADDMDGLRLVRQNTFLPIILDEPICTSKDIAQFVGLCDGINIKLMKCGGLTEALKMIGLAKSLKLKIMLGCMIESSLGITAMAHLASVADYLDLDGNLLISNDPFEGVKLVNGKLVLPKEAGLGIKRKA